MPVQLLSISTILSLVPVGLFSAAKIVAAEELEAEVAAAEVVAAEEVAAKVVAAEAVAAELGAAEAVAAEVVASVEVTAAVVLSAMGRFASFLSISELSLDSTTWILLSGFLDLNNKNSQFRSCQHKTCF